LPFFQLVKRDYFAVNIRHLSFTNYGEDTLGSNRTLRTGMYDDFQTHLVPSSATNNFQLVNPNINELSNALASDLLYDVITYMIAVLTLILLLVVFYFITDQSIKLQKTTLRFLKSNGENNYELSLITTLSSLMPMLIGTILGVVLSFGVSQIMISVTSITFPFYIAPFTINL
jgi:ABC-type antimicrobial peptide transport system permease subunit